MIEIWKDVVGFEGIYQISNTGKVKGLPRKYLIERLLKPYISEHGYLMVRLYPSGKHKTIHRLLAEAFIPNPDNKPFVNHKDANKQNNDLNNLEWVTRLENIHHAVRLGLYNCKNRRSFKGRHHPLTTLNEDIVLDIREKYSKGANRYQLAEEYSISYNIVNKIVNRITWRHI